MSFHPSLKEPFTQNWIAALFFLTALSLEAVVAFSNVFFLKLNIHCSLTSRSQFEGKCQRSKVRMGRLVEEHRKVTQMTTGYTQGLQNSFPEHTTHPSPVKNPRLEFQLLHRFDLWAKTVEESQRESDLSDSSGHVVVAGAGGRYLDSLKERQRHSLFTTTEHPSHY